MKAIYVTISWLFITSQLCGQLAPYTVCLDDGDADIGLDRKDWSDCGNSASDSYRLNFQVPDQPPFECAVIEEIRFIVSGFSDTDNTASGCFLFNYTNVVDCNGSSPCSCDLLCNNCEGQGVNNVIIDNSDGDIVDGQEIGYDIVAVIDLNNPACVPDVITNGQYSASFEVCMEIYYGPGEPEEYVDVGDDLEVCEDQSIDIIGPGGFEEYEWDGPVGSLDREVFDAPPGFYTLTVTDEDGCTSSDILEVIEVPSFDLEFEQNDPLQICGTDEVELSLLINNSTNYNGYDFDWSLPDGSTSRDETLSTSQTGLYNVTVTDRNDCQKTRSILITEVLLASAQIDSLSNRDTMTCAPSINVSAFIPSMDPNNYQYEWINGTDTIRTQDFTITESGSYVLNLINDLNCEPTSDTITVNFTQPDSAGDDSTASVCSGTQYDLSNALDNASTIIGTWIDLDGTGRLNNNIFNTSNLVGSFQFRFNVDNPDPCQDDFADITILVTDALEGNYNETICDNDSRIIEGELYDINNPTGFAMLQSVDGCDSIINIVLDFYDTYDQLRNDVLCEDETIMVNNVEYGINNPSDVVSLQTINGCDSTITIDLSFNSNFEIIFDDVLCSDDSREINGTIYDINNPSDILNLIASNGCDSTIIVDFEFVDNYQIDRFDEVCEDQTIEINGTIYSAMNPTDVIMLQSVNGCDSIINVDLQIVDEYNVDIFNELCADDTIVVNGETFSISNPSATFQLQSINGCDSIINVDLTFIQSFETLVEDTICFDESLEINGEVYDANNLSGMAMLSSMEGCDSTVIVEIELLPEIPVESFTENICQGDSVFVIDEWISIGAFLRDTLSAVNGCDSIINTEVVVNSCSISFTVFEFVDVSCFGLDDGFLNFGVEFMSYPLNYSLVNANTTFQDGTIDDMNVININDLEQGVYTITVTDLSGNQLLTEDFLINSPDQLDVQIDIEQNIDCADELAALSVQVSGGTGNYQYEWSNGSGDQSITNLEPDSYSITVTDENLCTEEASIDINNVDNIDFTFIANNATCLDPSSGSISIDPNIIGGTSPYTFSLDGINFSDQLDFENLVSGDYDIFISDANNCIRSIPFRIEQDGSENVDQIGPFTITEGESVELNLNLSFTPTSIIWNNPESLDCTDCTAPIANPIESTEYTVVIIDPNDCEITRTVLVTVIAAPIEISEIYIPNIFNPNDPNNRGFGPLVKSGSEAMIISFKIYDRWGNLVFEQQNPGDQWNGIYKNKDAENGVYLYIIESMNEQNVIIQNIGQITLIR